jgi:hypothetical protein
MHPTAIATFNTRNFFHAIAAAALQLILGFCSVGGRHLSFAAAIDNEPA